MYILNLFTVPKNYIFVLIIIDPFHAVLRKNNFHCLYLYLCFRYEKS
jgi:hypothetical protein